MLDMSARVLSTIVSKDCDGNSKIKLAKNPQKVENTRKLEKNENAKNFEKIRKYEKINENTPKDENLIETLKSRV